MNRKLVEAIAEALREYDARDYGETSTWGHYEEYAETAVRAYEAHEFAPRPRSFFVEGVQFA